MPIQMVATDMVSGGTVVLSEGSASDAIAVGAAIPGAFAPLRYGNLFLADGAISNNTPIKAALDKRAERLIIQPTGSACALHAPPMGAVANALHALTLLISRQLTTEPEYLHPTVEYHVVPPLCPLVGSPYDFSRTDEHIIRAMSSTDKWIASGGLAGDGISSALRPHKHSRKPQSSLPICRSHDSIFVSVKARNGHGPLEQEPA
jgi:NTE family protein